MLKKLLCVFVKCGVPSCSHNTTTTHSLQTKQIENQTGRIQNFKSHSHKKLSSKNNHKQTSLLYLPSKTNSMDLNTNYCYKFKLIFSDYYTFLGNFPPTRPLSQNKHLLLTQGKMLAQARGRWAVSQSAFSKHLVSAVDHNKIELSFQKYLLQGVLSNVCHFKMTTVSERVFNRT